MTSMSPELRELEELADLGLPLAPTRLRALKRVVIRLCWVFLHRQVDYNHGVVRSLERVRAEVARVADVAEGSAAWGGTLDDLRQRVGKLHTESLARHEEVLGLLRDQLGPLHEEVARASQTLSTQLVRSGVLEGQAADLSRTLLKIEERVAGLAETVAHAGATGQGPGQEPRDSQLPP